MAARSHPSFFDTSFFDTNRDVENIGLTDRILRTIVALALISQLFIASTVTLEVGLMAVAGILIGLSAACGWDPFYQLFGWRTHESHIAARFRAMRMYRPGVPVSESARAGPREPAESRRKAA